MVLIFKHKTKTGNKYKKSIVGKPKDEEESSQWFENTIHNLLYTIIYKLDKAKYIIPRMITFIRKFQNESLKNRFNEEIDQVPAWIWIFWLPILF